MAASIILSSVYDLPSVSEEEYPIIKQMNSFIEGVIQAGRPGAYMVDIFPFLNYLPAWLAPWKRDGIAKYEKQTAFYKSLYDDVKKKRVRVCFFLSSIYGMKYRTLPFFCSRMPENASHVSLRC